MGEEGHHWVTIQDPQTWTWGLQWQCGEDGRSAMRVLDRNRRPAVLIRGKCKVNQSEGPRKQEAGQQKGVLRWPVLGDTATCMVPLDG